MSDAKVQVLNKHHLLNFLVHPDGFIELQAKDEHGRHYTQCIELAYSWERCRDGMGDLLLGLAVYGFSALYGLDPGERVYKDEPIERPADSRIVLPS